MSNQGGRSDLLQQLRHLGVEAVTAEYDGSGDEGQISDPEFGSVEVPQALMRAVQYLFYDLLDQLYGGWENNEGAFGHVVWHVGNDSVNLVHNTRTESYETEEHNI